MDARSDTRERRHSKPETPRFSQPLRGAPARVRPTTVAGALAALYGLGAVPSGLALVWSEYDHVVQGILAWGIAAVLVGVPMTLAVALVAYRAERLLTGRVPPQPAAWLLFAFGAVMVAHWLPLTAWSPMLVLGSAMRTYRADEWLPLAVVAMSVWLAVALGGAAVTFGRRMLEQRSWASAPVSLPARGGWPPTPTVPTSLVIGFAVACSATVPTLAWALWARGAWNAGHGMLAVVAWTLIGAGIAVLCGGGIGSWLYGASALAPSPPGDPQLRRIEVVGAVLAGHFVPVFALCLTPLLRRDDDLRFSTLLLAFVVIAFATAVASGSRASSADVSDPASAASG